MQKVQDVQNGINQKQADPVKERGYLLTVKHKLNTFLLSLQWSHTKFPAVPRGQKSCEPTAS